MQERNLQLLVSEGNFSKILSGYDEDKLRQALLDLHTEKAINLLEFFLKLERGHPDFFHWRHIFNKIAPQIDATALEILAVFDHLTPNFGEDLSDGECIRAFQKYCKRGEKITEELYTYVLSKPHLHDRFLIALLEVGAEFDWDKNYERCLDLLSSGDESIILKGLGAISCLHTLSKCNLEQTYKKIYSLMADEISDDRLSCLLLSVAKIYGNEETGQIKIHEFLQKYYDNKSAKFIHACVLILQDSNLTIENKQLLFNIISNLDTKNLGTVKEIDYLLGQWIRSNCLDDCLSLLELILNKSDQSETLLSGFKSFLYTLNQKPVFLSEVFTKWLLSNQWKIRRCSRTVITCDTQSWDNSELEFTKQLFPNPEPSHFHLYLISRVISSQFFHPKVQQSFIQTILKDVPLEDRDAVCDLLFEWIYLNYPEMTDRWAHECNKDSSLELLSTLTQRIEKHKKDLTSLPTINELRPSLTQQYFFERCKDRYYNKLWKQSLSQNPLLNAFSGASQQILYGNTVINNAQGIGRSETMLSSVTHSVMEPIHFIFSPGSVELTLSLFLYKEFEDETHH